MKSQLLENRTLLLFRDSVSPLELRTALFVVIPVRNLSTDQFLPAAAEFMNTTSVSFILPETIRVYFYIPRPVIGILRRNQPV